MFKSVIYLGIVFSCLSCVSSKPQLIYSPGKSNPTIISAVNTPEAGRAVKSLSTFFQERGISTSHQTAMNNGRNTNALFIFETALSHPLGTKLGVDLSPLAGLRDEGHIISSTLWKGKPVIYVVGKTDSGIEAGVEYLKSKFICEVASKGYKVTSPDLKLVRNPFFKVREATLCPTGRAFPKQPEVNYENWQDDQLKLYPEFLKACGFNSIQFMELITYHAKNKTWTGGYRNGIPKGKTIDDIQHVLHTLMDATHNQGMRVSQYIWGSPPGDGNRWDDPKTRPARAEFYDEIARRYGKKVDHVITHWKDEGSEGGYETPLTATMYMRDQFKKYNPAIEVTCDAWWNADLYKGISTEKFATRDIGIAIERWYDEKRADQIINSGRKVGIWGWYLSDFEMTNGSKLYTKTLTKYFDSLPQKASSQIDWISLEHCFHGLPMRINMYLVGRKMWDPKESSEEIIKDYLASTYGIDNLEHMRLVYETVEEGQKEVRYGMVNKDKYPAPDKSTFIKKVKAAQDALSRVKIKNGWKPNFTHVVSPEEDIKNLRESLDEIEIRYSK